MMFNWFVVAVRFVAAFVALGLIGRLVLTAHAYRSWRAGVFYGLAIVTAVVMGLYRFGVSTVGQPLSADSTMVLAGMETVFAFGILASLWEHWHAERKRHADLQKLMDQWRRTTTLAHKRTQEVEVLFDLTRELAASLDLPEVLRAVVNRTLTLSEADRVKVFGRNPETGELLNYNVAAVAPGQAAYFPDPRPQGLTASVARSGQAAFIADATRHPLYAGHDVGEMRAIASVPLMFESDVVGVMNILFSQPHHFDDEEMRLLGALADTAALAVHNAAMHARITQLAVTDELTGLANRRRFMEVVRQEVQRARRYQRPLTLLMIDLDRLKSINDQNGHAAGDAMLRGVAEAMRHNMRATDYAARLGGDEFAALLPETGCDDAFAIAERIRAGVEKFSVTVNGALIHSTVSIGLVSRKPGEVTDLPSFIHLADDALYHSKTAGRNQVTVVDAPAPSPSVSENSI